MLDFDRQGDKRKEDGDRLGIYDVDLAALGTERAVDGRSVEANLVKIDLGEGLADLNNTSTFRHGLFTAGLSGNNMWDNLADGYNTFVDPAVDSLFGRDVSELGYAPEWMDHGVYVGGHAEFGLGSAMKIGVDAELGLKSSNVSSSWKGGHGTVVGVGANVGWK